MQLDQRRLQNQLHSFYDGFMGRLAPDDRKAIVDAHARVSEFSAQASALKVGDEAPDFTLADQHGRLTRLADQLHVGPVAVLFVRGEWCPFCALTLRAYQAALPAIHEAGGSLFALTPQPPDRCTTMAERDLLAFSTLSDAGNKVAERYGIVYEMPTLVRPLYLRLGHDLPEINRTGDWRLPLPATFLVGTDRRIALADVQTSFQERLDPAVLVAKLQSLASQA